MACYANLASSVAWYSGKDPHILDLQSNLNYVRKLTDRAAPHTIGSYKGLLMYLRPFYVNKDLLHYQLSVAEECWRRRETNACKATSSSGFQEMKKRPTLDRVSSLEQLQLDIVLDTAKPKRYRDVW